MASAEKIAKYISKVTPEDVAAYKRHYLPLHQIPPNKRVKKILVRFFYTFRKCKPPHHARGVLALF